MSQAAVKVEVKIERWNNLRSSFGTVLNLDSSDEDEDAIERKGPFDAEAAQEEVADSAEDLLEEALLKALEVKEEEETLAAQDDAGLRGGEGGVGGQNGGFGCSRESTPARQMQYLPQDGDTGGTAVRDIFDACDAESVKCRKKMLEFLGRDKIDEDKIEETIDKMADSDEFKAFEVFRDSKAPPSVAAEKAAAAIESKEEELWATLEASGYKFKKTVKLSTGKRE